MTDNCGIILTSARTESRGAFYFYGLHGSQFHIVGKAPVLSFSRAVLADVQAYDDTGVLRFMSAKDGKPCAKCGSNEWFSDGHCKRCKKEYSREYNRIWGQKNSVKKRDSVRAWRQANIEKERERLRTRPKESPEKKAEREHERRARVRNSSGKYTVKEWKALCDQYDNRCLACGRNDVKLTVDHVVPLFLGGTNSIDNIQPLCLSCNSRKSLNTTDYRNKPGLSRWIQRKLFGE